MVGGRYWAGMIKELWEEIEQGKNVRQNLSSMRQALKEEKIPKPLMMMENPEAVLTALLKDEDAKTRKNAALLIGDLELTSCLNALLYAYENEPQMFVKSAYLTALKNMDYSSSLDQLKDRLAELINGSWKPEQEKHVREEMRELSGLIVAKEGITRHRFDGWDEACSVVLLTNRNFPDLTLNGLKELEPSAKAKVFGAGVMAKVSNLRWERELRTYQELLFAVEGMQNCPMEEQQAADVILSSGFMNFMKRMHSGETPFYFRIEIKSKMDTDKKSQFVKKLSSMLETQSKRNLINSTSDYEVEIRLIENKEGSFNLLVKLYTLKDSRFHYRKEVSPYSIKPVNAALTIELTKEYLLKNARVLDPFCGVGTMLIERHKAVEADTSYGVDIQSEFIEKARENAENARQVIHFINRDFFDFTHEYPFDEIITDMPFPMGKITEGEIALLYKQFFKTAQGILRKGGIAVLYSHNKDHVKQYAGIGGFKILECFECSRVEGTYVYVLRQES